MPFPKTPTPTASITPTPSLTASQTPTQTPTQSVCPDLTPTATPTLSLTPSLTQTNTNTPSITPTNTNTPSITPTNTNTPSITPTNTPTPSITPEPDCLCYLILNETAGVLQYTYTPCGTGTPITLTLLGGANTRVCSEVVPTGDPGMTIQPCVSITACTDDSDCVGCT